MNRSKMKSFIQSLNADEAFQVLIAFINENPDRMKTIYDIALNIVGDADADAVMNDVYCELSNLDTDELYGRSGRTSHGYFDPGDVAWEMFEEALQPFIFEMTKNQRRSLPSAAKIHCIGIIKGLMNYEKDSNSDFKDWVIDAPSEFIETVVDEWKKGNPTDDDIAEVMNIISRGDKI